ncbi:MAG: hypothetical protein ACFHHU_00185 [Porticoccaceae bacterium]
MAMAPQRRARNANRRNPPRRVERAKNAIARVDSQLTSTVSALSLEATFRSHTIIGIIEAHWASVNTACYHLKMFMPILHDAKQVGQVADILDGHVSKMAQLVATEKERLDAIEANSDVVANVKTANALETEATITSRLGVKVFELLIQADALLFQADCLSLLDQMSDDQHSAFVQKINKGVRAVCTTIRQQHRRLQNELARNQNSAKVKEHEGDLAKAGMDLTVAEEGGDANADEAANAKPATKKTAKNPAKVADENDSEQVTENKDNAVAAE